MEDEKMFGSLPDCNSDQSTSSQYTIHQSSGSLDILESHVDIIDTGQMTTFSLQLCRKLVLARYHKLLIFIGWKPFGQRKVFAHPHLWKFLNMIYLMFIFICLIYSYIYEVMFCEGQDSIPSSLTAERSLSTTYSSLYRLPTTTSVPEISESVNGFASDECTSCEYGKILEILNSLLPRQQEQEDQQFCHEVTIYAIPNTIQLLAFIFGFWHFRISESEELDVLMERVFLQTQHTFGVQEKLTRNAKWFLISGKLWVIGGLSLSVLAICAYGFPQTIFHATPLQDDWLVILLAIFQFIGKVYSLCTYIAIIVNYSTQCEFLIHSIKAICLQLHEKTPYLKDAMHEILRIRELISRLNGSLGKMASMCVINFALKAIMGFCFIVTTENLGGLRLVHRIMFPIVYAPILFFPLIQACRVTKMGQKIRLNAFEIRIFGYKNCSQLEQDSFILFTNSAILRAKLFSVPVKPAYFVSGFTIVMFTLLLLLQTNVIQTKI